MRTKDQKYAPVIFEQVKKVRELGKSKKIDSDKYGSMAHKLPVLIRTAGLAQAVGFVASRGDEAHKLLLEHISQVVGVDDLSERSRKGELQDYIHLTREVMSCLVWYKRFAESVLDVKLGEEDDVGGGD